MTFAQWLDEAMDIQHMTAASLAEASDVSETNICRYRNGTVLPRIDVVAKLAYGLNYEDIDVINLDYWGSVD